MNDAEGVRVYQESKIEDEPILGPVLTLPDGRIQPLSWLERILVALRLANAASKQLRRRIRRYMLYLRGVGVPASSMAT